jgi:hypothetical protein
MSLPVTPNVAVDIYRAANPSSPYSLGAQSATGVPGYLQPAAAEGRFGTAQWLKWTHVLLLPPGTDVRDAYNSQLDPSRDNNNADTVILNDSAISGRRTAYYVVFVEIIGRNLPEQHVRAFLDRFTPSAWPTDSL